MSVILNLLYPFTNQCLSSTEYSSMAGCVFPYAIVEEGSGPGALRSSQALRCPRILPGVLEVPPASCSSSLSGVFRGSPGTLKALKHSPALSGLPALGFFQVLPSTPKEDLRESRALSQP